MRHCLSRILLLTFLPLLLGACAIAPAKVRRSMHTQVHSLLEHTDPALHDLLTTALQEAPDSEKGSQALGQFVEQWKREKHPAHETIKVSALTTKLPAYEVIFTGQDPAEHPLDYFDEIESASGLLALKIEHHERPGVGAPLLALRENTHRLAIERFFPPEIISRPLTAVVHAGKRRKGVQQVHIRLLCSLQNETVVLNGKRLTLAADFSLPWAAALSRSGKLHQSGILDLLTPTPKRQPQLYLMEAYDPRKEPLIMIHGLLSTPLAWAEISNDLWADPTIRQRYQIWHYLYNTSAPALYSARILRSQLRELRSLLDPEGDDPAMQHTTLLTHSMGGLIGKSLAVDPGDAFWKAAFKVSPESLKMSEEDRVMLKDAFFWKPDLTIHRIIYIATPHRGSAFADNLIGRAGSLITSPPVTFRTFYERISAANPDVFTPEYAMLGQGKLDSISSLSPQQPTLRILADMKLSPHVHTHSIIGNRGRSGPLEKSSDNIVPYTSSHLDSADSEVIVPTGHGAFRHPKAMAEILRVLHSN